MTRIRIFTTLLFTSLLCTFAVMSWTAQAADPRSLTESFDEVERQAESLGLNTESEPESILTQIIKDVLKVVGALALALVIYGGFIYLTSAGDDNRASKGKQIILSAIIGLIIIGLSAVIVNLTIALFDGIE